MLTKIINSGSDGNCTVLEDVKGNQLLLDCGLTYETIVANSNLSKINAILETHTHSDHSKSFAKFEKYGFTTFSPKNIEDNKPINISVWEIIPMKLVHNIECFGFFIYNKIENKKIVYCTDTSYIPKVGNVDMMIVDTNYDEEIVFEKLSQGMQINMGYKNHCSTQTIVRYLQENNYKPQNFVAYHISNSNLQDIKKIEKLLNPLVGNLYIAKPNTQIEF